MFRSRLDRARICLSSHTNARGAMHWDGWWPLAFRPSPPSSMERFLAHTDLNPPQQPYRALAWRLGARRTDQRDVVQPSLRRHSQNCAVVFPRGSPRRRDVTTVNRLLRRARPFRPQLIRLWRLRIVRTRAQWWTRCAVPGRYKPFLVRQTQTHVLIRSPHATSTDWDRSRWLDTTEVRFAGRCLAWLAILVGDNGRIEGRPCCSHANISMQCGSSRFPPPCLRRGLDVIRALLAKAAALSHIWDADRLHCG